MNAATTRIAVHPQFHIGEIDRRMFGSFVEHLGRCVYTGIYEPSHLSADEHGFRGDVADLVRELGPTVVRYPGGNFVSNYRWEDGVGPRAQRAPFLELAWRTIEPNDVGVDEFLQWCERTGLEPMLAVNLGTRGVEAAAALVEYCNGQAGSRWADLRVANGRTEPYGVTLWCLGNEMDGPWQIGHMDAGDYGKLAAAAGRAMKQVDPDIELVACGSSGMDMPTFGSWERTVLSHCIDIVDHISMHAYYEQFDDDRASFLGSATAMDRFIDRVAAVADSVDAEQRAGKRVTISFDEWNVWYLHTRFAGGDLRLPVQRDAPRIIEDVYSARDAVVVGDLLITLLNHADRVRIGCQAQLVNAIAPIMTEPGGAAWRQPTFHPFAATARLARGTALDVRIETPAMPTGRHGDVPTVTAAATWDASTGRFALFLVNRSDEPQAVDVVVSGFGVRLSGGIELVGDGEGPREGRQRAEAVRPVERAAPEQEGGTVRIELSAESWSAWSGTS